MEKIVTPLLEYQYALGLTLGCLAGALLGSNVLSFIVLIWFIVLIERWIYG